MNEEESFLRNISQEVTAKLTAHDNDDLILVSYVNQLQSLEQTFGGEDVAFLWEFRFYLWEKLHSFHWYQTQSSIYREYYGYITCILVFCLYSQSVIDKSTIAALIHLADVGLLLANDKSQPFLHRVIACLQKYFDETWNKYSVLPPQTSSWKIRLPVVDMNKLNTVSITPAENIQLFYEEFLIKQQPVILTGMMCDWPAFEKWKDIRYFLKSILKLILIFFKI
jgi:hypothetical protein